MDIKRFTTLAPEQQMKRDTQHKVLLYAMSFMLSVVVPTEKS